MKKLFVVALLLPFMMAAGDDCSSGCSLTTDPDCKERSETLKLSGIWNYQRDTAGGLSHGGKVVFWKFNFDKEPGLFSAFNGTIMWRDEDGELMDYTIEGAA